MKQISVFLFLFFVAFTGFADIQGIYKLAKGPSAKKIPAEKSLNKVRIIEVFSFTCPHCYRANKELPAFLEKFKGKIDFIHYEIGWLGPDPAKFYYLSNRLGKGPQTRNLLFSAFHELNIKSLNDPVSLRYFSKELGFEKEFKSDFSKPDLLEEFIDKQKIINQFGIKSVPTFIVENSITVGPGYKNLEKVINSLLKTPVK